MRKKYEKPMLFRETFQLDASIAQSTSCDTRNETVMAEIQAFLDGCEDGTSMTIDDVNNFLKRNPNNTYCYHQFAEGQTLFTS